MAEDLFGIVGTTVASAYHVESVVAEGGFGIVYRAHHGGFRAPVALKCLKVPQHLGAEYQARFLEQFRAEAELMFRLSASTPTVTRPLHLDVMTTPDGTFVPFMVLEWLEGQTFDALIRARQARGSRPFALSELLELFAPVAKALERAHHFRGPQGSESIAHCDLKPENVFVANVGGERVVKILDFGVAKVQSAATRAAAGRGEDVTLFTPSYGAPEQWNPKLGETGPWTDVWGLALTLAEGLAGRPVVAGDRAALRAQLLDPKRRPTPRQQGLAVSDEVEAVFQRALAIEPRDRYPDAGVFFRALVEAAERVPNGARPSGPEIPDLVPLERKPSHPELQAVRGPVSFDFDDSEQAAPAFDLDLPADEPIARRSSPPAVAPLLAAPPLAEALTVAAEAPPLVPPPAAPLLERPPSLAPITPRAAVNGDLPRAPAPEGAAPPAAEARVATPVPAASERPLVRRLVPGLSLTAASVALTLLDRIYAAAAGEVFTLGPMRTSWLAAALLVGGLGLCARELLARD